MELRKLLLRCSEMPLLLDSTVCKNLDWPKKCTRKMLVYSGTVENGSGFLEAERLQAFLRT